MKRNNWTVISDVYGAGYASGALERKYEPLAPKPRNPEAVQSAQNPHIAGTLERMVWRAGFEDGVAPAKVGK